MKIAVFGSREGFDSETIRAYLAPRFDPTTILVSGGARGVDSFAEQAWQSLGGNVISLRPTVLSGGCWAVERWESNEGRVFIPVGEPEWADFKSAAFYRNMLIAEEADAGVAFHANNSRGTWSTRDAFEAEGKPCSVHTP